MTDAPRPVDAREAVTRLEPEDRDRFRGAVIVGAVPGESARVYAEAADIAHALGVPLVVAYVDVTRFIAGTGEAAEVLSVPVDIALSAGEFDDVAAEAGGHLADFAGDWAVRQVVGDPALALRRLAGEVDARMIVVGTRKRGVSERLREVLYGSVAVRLAHRQRRPVLVVPQQKGA